MQVDIEGNKNMTLFIANKHKQVSSYGQVCGKSHTNSVTKTE